MYVLRRIAKAYVYSYAHYDLEHADARHDRDLELAARSDVLTDFSSRGPTGPDFRFKPDIVCPGHYIVSAMAESTSTCSLRLMSGTSMATPICAGATALGVSFVRVRHACACYIG